MLLEIKAPGLNSRRLKPLQYGIIESMTEKTRIIDDLGEVALLLPARLNMALVANDQIKYLFTLLQNATQQADHCERDVDGLALERQEVGIENAEFDEIVENTQAAEGRYSIPHYSTVCQRIFALVETMIDAVRLAAAIGDGVGAAELAVFERRAADLAALSSDNNGVGVAAADVSALTRGTRQGGDSVHILVMDLHKLLNRLQAQVAQDSIAGASVYQLREVDRPLVEAFMSGLNRTAPLKFGHPGLGTTATNIGSRLVLQNDIGTTDAHVFVVNVEDRTVNLVYTDIHLPRLNFFKDMLSPFALEWRDTQARRVKGFEQDSYYLASGRFAAADDGELQRYLTYLGSRLVFLIDWNKARKRLRELVRKKEAVKLLRWAADHDYGHRAFLELGGEQLIYRAIEFAAMGESHYGQPLYAILGEENTLEFLKYAIRAASEGLSEGRNWRLIEDQIRAELLNYFRSVPQELLSLASRHGELIFETADLVRSALLRLQMPDTEAFMRRAVGRAAHWEREADRIVNEVRTIGRRTSGPSLLRELIEEQDDVVDFLEESVFLATLLDEHELSTELLEPFARLAAEVVAASQEFNKVLESAQHVHRGGARDDFEDFFHAVERVVDLEHRTDESERLITRLISGIVLGHGVLHLSSRLSASLEAAADSMSRCSHMLRDYIVEEVMAA